MLFGRNCVNEEEAGAHFAADLHTDVTPLLPSISSPTLLLQPSDAPMAPMAWGRELASSIPRAQLKVLKTSVLWSDEIEEWIIASIRDFLAVEVFDVGVKTLMEGRVFSMVAQKRHPDVVVAGV